MVPCLLKRRSRGRLTAGRVDCYRRALDTRKINFRHVFGKDACMPGDEDDDLYDEEFDFVDDDESEDDEEVAESNSEAGEEPAEEDADAERGEGEEEVDEYGRPAPQANYVVHI